MKDFVQAFVRALEQSFVPAFAVPSEQACYCLAVLVLAQYFEQSFARFSVPVFEAVPAQVFGSAPVFAQYLGQAFEPALVSGAYFCLRELYPEHCGQ